MDFPESKVGMVMSQVPLTSDDGTSPTASIPVGYKSRKMTDKYFLIIYIFCVIITLAFAVYILNKSDLTKLEETTEDDSYPYYPHTLRVEKGILGIIQSTLKPFVFTLVISIGICISIIAGLKFAPLCTTWCTLAGTVLAFFICAAAMWGYVGQLWLTLIIIAVAVAIGIFIMRNHISDIAILYGEASRVIFQVPATFVVSIVVMVVSIIILLIPFWTITNYMLASRTAKSVDQFADYKIAALVLISIMSYWSFEIIIGVQYLIVSGAVADWSFNRERDPQHNPVYDSARVTFRYHLGTAVLGSVMVGLLHFFRINVLLATIIRFTCGGCVRGPKTCCLIFTKVPYTVTAMKGTPFFKSNSKAKHFLEGTIWMTSGVFKYANYISAMAYMFVVCLSALISFFFLLLFPSTASYALIYLFMIGIPWVVCLTSLGMLDCIVNTMLMCLCENERPPFMTPGMERFVNVVKT